jgi:hypothetical protein
MLPSSQPPDPRCETDQEEIYGRDKLKKWQQSIIDSFSGHSGGA